jgi:hypothetical protein
VSVRRRKDPKRGPAINQIASPTKPESSGVHDASAAENDTEPDSRIRLYWFENAARRYFCRESSDDSTVGISLSFLTRRRE